MTGIIQSDDERAVGSFTPGRKPLPSDAARSSFVVRHSSFGRPDKSGQNPTPPFRSALIINHFHPDTFKVSGRISPAKTSGF
jgi:hypothetical protein